MDASPLQDRRVARGGVALVATLQFFLAELVTASAWSPAYSYAHNYISDLGVPECLVLDRIVCSPQWFVADAAFVVQGLIAIVAVLALAWLVPGRWRVPVAALGMVHAVGFVLVGVFPGSMAEAIGGDSVRMTIHTIGAVLALGVGNLWAIVAGIAMRGRWRRWAVASIVLGAVGLAAGVLSRWTDLGLGIGGIERLSAYPILVWLALTGFALLASRRAEAERLRIESAQAGPKR